MTERDIFLSALDLSPADRPAFVAERCGTDEPLRRRVEALLAAHAAAERFLEQPAAAGADTFTHRGPADQPTGDHAADPEPDRVGQVLAGRYKLLERIGEGGMGSVWMAEQTEPVKRKVAVKLIRSGLDSRAVLARFEAERQALAVMDHPNIAKVLDGGLHDARPFFVMELVKGVPITEFCDQRRLTPRQRLELFVPVCQAIQHAHQKGVIHRDIKPSNVLVALYDDKPVPKVIDFGVAKAAGQTLTDKTLHTGFGTVVGTPEYMSPEQASFNNLDIDTRSDVYSLGVLLYELLTGTTPVDRRSLKEAAVLEVLRIVREVDAPRPSAKLSTSATLPSIAASRGTEPAKLTKQVKGELDWLVLKALEKDRVRRYESAAGLAADVGRFLAGEPVHAVPPSAGYRLRKFVRRHRGRVAAAAVVLLVLLAGVIGTAWQAVRATRAEAAARAHAADAERNAEEARKQRDLHWAEAERATEAEIEAKVMAYGLEVDLDLAVLKTDETGGLLRLARRANTLIEPRTMRQWTDPDGGKVKFHLEANPVSINDLRGLVQAVTLAVGQTYAPLLPPLWTDDADLLDTTDGPDGRTVLTRDKAGVVRVWDALRARPPLTLRQRDERAVHAGFSPDGRTLFTQDEDSIVRFWNPDGTFRAKTPLRAERYCGIISLGLRSGRAA